jgi:plastocyanin
VVIGFTGIGTEAGAETESESAAATGQQEASSASGADVTLVAENIAFDTSEIAMPADQDVAVTLDNQDAVPHNFALYETEADADAQEPALFQGENVDGGATFDYEFTSPPPGEYVFQCDVHPTMRGTATTE